MSPLSKSPSLFFICKSVIGLHDMDATPKEKNLKIFKAILKKDFYPYVFGNIP